MNGEGTPSDGWRADDGPEPGPRRWVAPGDEGRSPSQASPTQQSGFAPPQQAGVSYAEGQPGVSSQEAGVPYLEGQPGFASSQEAGVPYLEGRPGVSSQEAGVPYLEGQPGFASSQQAGVPYPEGQQGAPYGQAGFTAPIGPPPWTPGIAPRRRRTGLIVGISVAAAVLLLGGIGVAGVAVSSGHGHTKKLLNSDGLVSQSPSPMPGSPAPGPPAAQQGGPKHSLTVPGSAGGYDRVTSDVANRDIAEIRASMIKAQPSYSGIYQKAKIGIYKRFGTPTGELIYLGMSAGESPELDTVLRGASADTITAAVVGGLGIDNATHQAPGRLGGVLRCGHTELNGIQVSSCVWVDGSTLGMVLLRPGPDDATAARVSVALRTAAEH